MTENSFHSNEPSKNRDLRTGMKLEDIAQAFLDNLFCAINRGRAIATKNDLYTALALTDRKSVV